MIQEFVKAWNKNNKLLLKDFEKQSPTCYKDIVEKLVNIVINPYLEEHTELDYPMDEGLDIDNMTVIDDGDYQGTTIYVIPFDAYQPDVSEYVFTHNYYGSCSGCDTFQSIEMRYNLWDDEDDTETDKIEAAKEFHTLALHILQNFRFLYREDEKERD